MWYNRMKPAGHPCTGEPHQLTTLSAPPTDSHQKTVREAADKERVVTHLYPFSLFHFFLAKKENGQIPVCGGVGTAHVDVVPNAMRLF